MIEMVFALLLLQDHKIIEHRYHESLSSCMKARRYAMKDRSPTDRVVFKCLQSKANIEVYKNNPVGIGEHPDLVAAVDEQVAKLAEAEDKLESLKSFMSKY